MYNAPNSVDSANLQSAGCTSLQAMAVRTLMFQFDSSHTRGSALSSGPSNVHDTVSCFSLAWLPLRSLRGTSAHDVSGLHCNDAVPLCST